jgi:hypothetical protein
MSFLMFLSPLIAAEGPRLDVLHPADDEVLRTKEVVVSGAASPAMQRLSLGGDELSMGTFVGAKWTGGSLSFSPKALFKDEFDGSALDLARWTILKDPANVSVNNGQLTLKYNYTALQTHLPLVMSKPFTLMPNVDFVAEFKLQFQQYSYSGAGGGISRDLTSPTESHLAVLEKYESWDKPWWTVYGDGVALSTKNQADNTPHVFTLAYNSSSKIYGCSLDDVNIGTFTAKNLPDAFWFGEADACPTYYYFPTVIVDFARVWTTSGEWVSEPMALDSVSVIDGCTATWDSSNAPSAEAGLWLRFSQDNVTWSGWTVAKEDLRCAGIRASWVQFKMKLDVPSGPKESSVVRVTGIDLDFHHSLASVEVRRAGGEWVTATGLDSWSVHLALLEDDNTIEVRATDTSGAITTTTTHIIVDTTPPTGMMAIQDAPDYTNKRDVMLALDASDRYGVEWVELAHSADFINPRRVAYADKVPWTLEGAQGTCSVNARFIDAHGLVSAPVSASIYYDDLAPLGSVSINGMSEYSSTMTVALELMCSDNTGVATVELSNDPGFAKATTMAKGENTVKAWALEDGPDGQRTVYLRVIDVAGNVIVASDSIELFLPKAVGSVTIDGGSAATQSTIVELRIDAPSAYRMRLMQISTGPTFEGAEWEAFATEERYFLPAGDGEKTVFVRFQDFRDIVSLPITASILLDATPPQVSVTINDGETLTTDTQVSVKVVYEDACQATRMWVSSDPTFARVEPQAFAGTLAWTIPSYEADHIVYVRVSDAAGNVGEGHGSIRFATVRPVIKLGLPDGSCARPGSTLLLGLDIVDPYDGVEVQWAIDGEPGQEAPWHPAVGNLVVDIAEGVADGQHKLNVRARNVAGLMSDLVAIGIVVDSIPPTVSILIPEDGTTIRQTSREIQLRVEAEDANPLVSVTYNLDGGEPTLVSLDTLEANVTVGTFGKHVVEVVATDIAGNVATNTVTFDIEQGAAAVPAATGSMLVLLLLVAAASVSAVAYGGFRRRTRHGPRGVATGDGWVEEFTAPHLIGTDNRAGLPPEPAPLAPVAAPADEPAGELEDVDVPVMSLIEESSPTGGASEAAPPPTTATVGAPPAGGLENGVPEGEHDAEGQAEVEADGPKKTPSGDGHPPIEVSTKEWEEF